MKNYFLFFTLLLSITTHVYSQKGIEAISKKDSSKVIIKEGTYVVMTNVYEDEKWKGTLKVINDSTVILRSFFKEKPDTVNFRNVYEIRRLGAFGILFRGVIITSVVATFIAAVNANLGEFFTGSIIVLDGIAGTGGFVLGKVLDKKYSKEKYHFKIQTTTP